MNPLRRLLMVVLAGITGSVVLGARPALAHGFGGRADLPVPTSYFIVGAMIAIIVSFVAVAVLWPEPRLQADTDSPLRHPGWLGPVRWVLGAFGLIALTLVILAGVLNQDGSRTISPSLVFVYFWLVVPFLAVVLGNWWHVINPWRLLSLWINSDTEEHPERASRLGVWPAAVAFVAFTWLELVSDTSDTPRTLASAALIYSIFVLGMTRYFGVRTGLATAEAFEMYNRLIGAISAFEWSEDEEGRSGIRRRGWLRGLTNLAGVPGLTFFVVAMIGTVTYDGMSGAEWWSDAWGDIQSDDWFETLALISIVAMIGLAYWAASAVAAAMASHPGGAAGVARSFAHTLVPIAVAYAVAHYFTLILVEGQILLHAASDPFGRGWDLFGTAGWRISWVPSPEVVWYVQVATIVIGHVLGVVLAHDRALADFGERVAVRTQYAMLVLMVGLTSLGLLILSG